MKIMIFLISRIYNQIILGLALFLIKRTWDFTKRNKDIISDAKERTNYARIMLGSIK